MNKIKSIATKLIPGITVFTILLIVQHVACKNNNGFAFGNRQTSPLHTDESVSRAVMVQDSFRKIFDLYQNKVVYISTEQIVKQRSHPFFNDPFFKEFFGRRGAPDMGKPRTRKRTGLGTGFVLSKDGYICTNHHVVAHVDKVTVTIQDKVYNAEIIGSDQRTDIALLKIKPEKDLEPAFLGDSDQVRGGDWAIAIGNPFGLDKTFTTGVISATGRKDLDMMGGSGSHIQTDASINPGNSGGPLINIYGEVIGINRMIYSRSGGNMGIGFAIPINTAKTILEQLKEHKKVKRGFIGIQVVPFTKEYSQELGLKDNKGALIGALLEDGPAAKAGMKVGDVILKIKDKEIKDFRDLLNVVEHTEVGKTVKATVWRRKSKINLFITVAERP